MDKCWRDNMAVAVACGAFAAHGLETAFVSRANGLRQTGTQYFLSRGLLIVGMLLRINLTSPTIAWVMQLGIVLFTGSLYLMALGMPRWLGAITPIGGTLFIIAWIWFAIGVAKHTSSV